MMEGINWLEFWDWLINWAQWAITVAVCVLILAACLCFFIDKGKMVGCALGAMIIVGVAVIFNNWGIQILAPGVYDFFGDLFGGFFS